jgi:hypothetical protein
MIRRFEPHSSALLVGAAVLGWLGCQNSSKSGSASPSPTASSAPAVSSVSGAALCAHVTAAEVEKALGLTGLESPTVAGEPPVTQCEYPTRHNPEKAAIRYQSNFSAADFAIVRKSLEDSGQPTRDAPGLGDVAFSSSVGGMNSIFVLVGKMEVVVISAGPALAAEEGLARTAIARL